MPMHKPEQCAGTFCPFHNPSNHHMRNWPIVVRYDRYGLAERKCIHNVGHPDEDSVQWLKKLYDNGTLFNLGIIDPPDPEELNDPDYDPYSAFTIHGCCGCCAPPTDDCVYECTHDMSTEMENGHWEN